MHAASIDALVCSTSSERLTHGSNSAADAFLGTRAVRQQRVRKRLVCRATSLLDALGRMGGDRPNAQTSSDTTDCDTQLAQASATLARMSTQAVVDRSTYIGSSDAALIANLSPWGSPLTVWNRLVGLTPAESEPTLRMYLGKRLEPIVLDLYEARTQTRPAKLLDDDAPPIMHKQHAMIGCHPDYDHLEVKTARSSFEWGEDESVVSTENMTIPLHYYLQVQHQMAVMGWASIDVAVLIAHDDFKRYIVPADKNVIERLIAAELELWDFAQRGVPPPLDDAASRKAYLRARFPKDVEPMRPATEQEQLQVMRWRKAVDTLKEAELHEALEADRVKAMIGHSSGLSGLASYKLQTRTTIDTDRLRERLREIERLDILRDVTRSSEFRVLRSIGRKESDE